MAENNLTTYITATADFTSLRTQLAGVTAQLIKLQETTVGTNAKLGNQIAVMNKAFTETLRSTGQFSTHFVTMSSDVQKFGKNLDSGQLKLNQYFKVWQGHTKNTGNLIRDLAKQQVMFEQAIVQPLGKNAQGMMQYNVQVAKGLDLIKNKTALARQEASILNKVMLDGSNQLINWGKNTQWAGRQLTVGLTVPLAAFGMAAQKAFKEADQELVRLQKVYGGLAAVSATELAKVRADVSATAKEIASSYGVAFKDTISLAADLAATGKEGNDLIEATQQTTRLAVLGEVDRQEAMKATLAIQNAFKQNTEELTASIDFLNSVENQTSTSLQDLTEAIPKAGPVVKALGGSVKDLALYMTAMKEGGIDASQGANAIKSAMASLINPTKVAKEMFMGFGIDLGGIVTSNAGDLTGTVLALQSALDKLDPLSKSKAIEQLFGKFQFARMSALFDNLGKSGSQTLQVMDLMKASAADLASISEREMTMMTESASGKFKRALASVQADLAKVGAQFLTISTQVLKVVDGIIKFFEKLPQPIKTALNFLGGLTAVAGPLIMLTGVLANFVGYVIKGVFHLKSLIKGGQGFKLLTPEIVAATAAGKGLEATFYSDAEATNVLRSSVDTLTQSFANLEMKANAAKVSMNPAIRTVAGSVIAAGTPGGRMVDKNNPLIGKPYTRDMSHMIPAGSPQMGTIFGTVPGAGPVNQRIGKNPQSYMNQDLPRIPGVTSVNGISNGIVAQEAAKWHAMTAAIAMQSEAEIKVLKAEVTATGTVTSSLSDSYQALLPQFSEITQLAAAETQAIVQQLQASKITVDQARAKVIQLNATVEAMLAETTALTAQTMGRTANLTMVPFTSQPVVDPATGKSNMKEMFHKGSTKNLVDKIARSLGGVRTSGAGYSIQTTKPTGLNAGGKVYDPARDGNVVPGSTSIKYDNTPAVLQEGGFVLNQDASKNNPDLVHLAKNTRNAGGKVVPALLTPGETYFTPEVAEQIMPTLEKANSGSRIQLRSKGGGLQATAQAIRSLFTSNRPSYRKQIATLAERRNLERAAVRERDSQFVGKFANRAWLARGASTRSVLDDYVRSLPAGQRRKAARLLEEFSGNVRTGRGGMDKGFARDTFAIESGHLEKGGALDKLLTKNKLPSLNLEDITHATHLTQASVRNGKRFVSKYTVDFDSRSNLQANHGTLLAKNFLERNMVRTGKYDRLMQQAGVSKSKWATTEQEIDAKIRMLLKGKESKKIGDEKGDITFDSFIPAIDSSIIAAGGSATKLKRLKTNSVERKNAGGMIGGRVVPGRRNYGYVNSGIGQLGMKIFKGGYKSPLMMNPDYEAMLAAKASAKFASRGADANGQVWHTPPMLKAIREGKVNLGKYPQPKSYFQDMANTDPAHGALQIGKYVPALHVRNQLVAPTIRYRSPSNWQGVEGTRAPAFASGSIEERAKSSLYNYMQGDYQAIKDPAVQAYLSTIRTKFTGTLHRGVKDISSLPPSIAKLIQEGRWSDLAGKEFIMRRSSWSKNKDTAEGFGQLQMTASVKNRNAVPASEIFPDLTFQSPKGPVPVNESEVYMGGKFRVVAASKNKLKLQAVIDGKREMGGPVGAGKSYLVGEKGPELFVPRNSGGIVPNYALGGRVHSGKNNYGNPLLILAAMAAAQMGSSWAGNKIGGGLGQGLSAAGNILPFMLMGGMGAKGAATMAPKLIPQSAKSTITPLARTAARLQNVEPAATKSAAAMNMLKTSVGRLLAAFTPLSIGIGVATAAIAGGVIAWKKNQEWLKTNALGYGLTAEAAQKAGLKFKDFNSTLKNSAETLQANREANTMMYESMVSSGTPIKMTIAEYKKLKTEVKSVFAESIKTINQTSGSEDLAELAKRLKTQLIGAGLSAEEATKKIYAMFAVSERASSASRVTTASKDFMGIKTAADAAVFAINAYNKSRNASKQEAGAAFNNAEAALTTAVDDAKSQALNAREKDKTKPSYISTQESSDIQYKAEQIALDGVISKLKEQGIVTKKTLDELRKTNPLINEIAGNQETVLSLWQKTRLAVQGYTGDLKGLNSDQTGALYELSKIISKGASDSIQANGGLLDKQYDKLNSLKALQEKYLKASKGQSVQQQINARDAIAALQKQIDANNKLTDARLKALDVAKSESDLGNEIAKEKAKYDAAIATGNSAEAQQSSLSMAGLQKQLQYNAQRKAIEDSNTLKNAPLEAQIAALNKKNQTLSDNAALAGDKLGDLSKEIDKSEGLYTTLNTKISDFAEQMKTHKNDMANWQATPEYKKLLTAISGAGSAAGVDMTKYSKDPIKAGKQMYDEVSSGIEAALSKAGIIANKDIIINGVKIGDIASKEQGKKGVYGQADLKKDNQGYMSLDQQARNRIMGDKDLRAQYGLDKKGAKFTFDGVTYSVDMGFNGVNPRLVVANYGANKPVKKALGGLIRGPGTPTSDSIYMPSLGSGKFASGAYVSTGEYVVNAAAVNQPGILNTLERINSKSYSVPKSNFNAEMPDRSSGSGPVVNITNNINGYDGDINQLSDLVTRKTITAIKSIDSINGKMVGSNKNVSIRT
jgi:TP901 family phage tail tape measure protein